MLNSKFFINVTMGVLRAIIITLIFLAILSLLMMGFNIEMNIVNSIYLIVTCVAVVYGSIYSARKNNRKGWIAGFFVSLMYIMLLYFLTFFFFNNHSFDVKDLIRILLAIAVGILSGMLGINTKD